MERHPVSLATHSWAARSRTSPCQSLALRRRRLGRPTLVWCNLPTRASKPPSKPPNGCPLGPPRCSRWESLSSRCIGHSVSMTKCASSRPRTTRRPPVRCWQRTCSATSARGQCVLSRLLRWKRSWATCPDQVVVRLTAKRGRCKQMHVYEVRPRKDRRGDLSPKKDAKGGFG